jgi:hypothetical protein
MIFQEKAKELIQRIIEQSNAEYEKPIERLGNRFYATITQKKQ